jgi:hypothetical protein
MNVVSPLSASLPLPGVVQRGPGSGQRARALVCALALAAGAAAVWAASDPAAASVPATAEDAAAPPSVSDLGRQLAVGDLVFIRIPARPFRDVAEATASWTNHVGIVVDVSGPEPRVAESRVPWSGSTSWRRFAARSEGGRIAVMRLAGGLTAAQSQQVGLAAGQRMGVIYDTGFDLHSGRQFCSRYVREVLLQATGQAVGEVETLAELLQRRPQTDLRFWRLWYLGNIPWQRQTVTPASVLRSDQLMPVFDGVVAGAGRQPVQNRRT